MITVSIPVWDTPVELVERAVTSVLANEQTSIVIVTYDGPTVHEWYEPTDPRVVVWQTRDNHGRYFIDDVVSRVCPTPYFTVHDADDASEPGRLDALLTAGVDVAYTDRLSYNLNGTTSLRRGTPRLKEPVDILWGVMALYRTAWVRGLFHPGFRVSWDAVLDHIGLLYGSHARVDGPLYEIHRRAGSLTNDPRTKLRSDYRRAVGRIHASMWRNIRATCSDRDDVERYIAAETSPALAKVRDAEVRRLVRALRAAALTSRGLSVRRTGS